MNPIDINSGYKINGAVHAFKDVLAKKPEIYAGRSAATQEKYSNYIKQMEQRNEALSRLAQAYPAEIHGQVMVNGKLFATVWEDGAAEMSHDIGNISNDGEKQALANVRLRDIAKAVGGEIRYGNFQPPLTGEHFSVDKIPQHLLDNLPQITSRFEELLLADQMRTQAAYEALNRQREAQNSTAGSNTKNT